MKLKLPKLTKNMKLALGVGAGFAAVGLALTIHDRFSVANAGQPSSGFTFGWWTYGIAGWPLTVPGRLLTGSSRPAAPLPKK